MRRLVLAGLLLAWCGGAHARTTDVTEWIVAPDSVTVRVTMPDDANPAATTAALSAYVLAHLDVHAGPDPCPPADQGQDVGLIDPLAPEPGKARFEIVFRCPHAGALRLDNHILFGRDPGHVGFARIRTQSQPAGVTRLFVAAHQSVQVPASGVVAAASLSDYGGLGLSDLLGPLPVALLLALLLAARRRDAWIVLAAGLACGYAASIALMADHLALMRPEAVGTLTGLLIMVLALRPRGDPAGGRLAACLGTAIVALAAVEVIGGHVATAILLAGDALLAPALLLLPASQPLVLLVPSGLFGLLGTAAFASQVAALVLPDHQAAAPMAGYAAGALIGAALCAAAVAVGLRLMRRVRSAPAIQDAAATALAGVGMWWLVGRLHG